MIPGFGRGRSARRRRRIQRVHAVSGAKAIGQEVGERHLFLRHEAALRQAPRAHQVERRADARGRGELDGRERVPVHHPAHDAGGVGLLHKAAAPQARGAGEHHDDVLFRRGDGRLQDVPQ